MKDGCGIFSFYSKENNSATKREKTVITKSSQITAAMEKELEKCPKAWKYD